MRTQEQFNTPWVSSNGNTGNEGSKLQTLSLLPTPTLSGGYYSSPKFSNASSYSYATSKARDVKQSHPTPLVCENQKMIDNAQQRCPVFYCGKDFGC